MYDMHRTEEKMTSNPTHACALQRYIKEKATPEKVQAWLIT